MMVYIAHITYYLSYSTIERGTGGALETTVRCVKRHTIEADSDYGGEQYPLTSIVK
jgi:hypothetical protein